MLSLLITGVTDNSPRYIAGIIDTGGKLSTSLGETSSKFTGGVKLICANF
jgi:hypothetical protein